MTATVAYIAALARVVLERLPEATRRQVKAAVRGMIANPNAGFWIGEASGFVLRMLPLDGWRLYYTVGENEITVTEILPASQAPKFMS